MTMLVVLLVQVLLPLLQLAPATGAQSGIESTQRCLHLRSELLLAELRAHLHSVTKQFEDDLLRHCSARREPSMFRRIARRDDQLCVSWIGAQSIQPKLRSAFHYWPRALAQELFVFGVAVIVVVLRGEPCTRLRLP